MIMPMTFANSFWPTFATFMQIVQRLYLDHYCSLAAVETVFQVHFFSRLPVVIIPHGVETAVDFLFIFVPLNIRLWFESVSWLPSVNSPVTQLYRTTNVTSGDHTQNTTS